MQQKVQVVEGGKIKLKLDLQLINFFFIHLFFTKKLNQELGALMFKTSASFMFMVCKL